MTDPKIPFSNNTQKPSYEELEHRLAKAEEDLRNLMQSKGDSSIGQGGKISSSSPSVEKDLSLDREQHLTALLRGIREVNQLITHEKNPEKLIRQACESLTESMGCNCVWIALVDERDNCVSVAQAGMDDRFHEFKTALQDGKWPRCVEKARESNSVVVLEEDFNGCCDCSLSEVRGTLGALATVLRHGDRAYGFMAVLLPQPLAMDREEHALFEEVAGDLAFALYLIESEQRMRLQARIMDRVRDVVTLTDLEGRIITVNKAVEKVFGRSEAELRGQTVHVYGEDAGQGASQDEIIRRTFNEGEWRGEVVNIDADGREIVLDCHTVLIRDEETGEPQYMCGVARDISLRVKYERELRDALQLNEEYLQLAGVMFIALDRDGLVTLANRKACEVLGCHSPGELIGLPWIDTFIPEEHRDRMRETLVDMLEGKREKRTHAENPVLTLSGEERLVEWNNSIVFNGHGNVIGTLSSGEDITERRMAEDQLRKSEELLSQTGELVRVGGWELDLETKRMTWTRVTAQIHELPEGHFPPLEDAYGYYVPEHRPIIREAVEKALEQGIPYDHELRFATARGHQIWVRVIGRPEVVDGKVVRLHGTFQDITERKTAEEERIRLATAIDQSPEMILITDASGIIQYVNPSFEKLTGYTREEVLGNTPTILKSGKHGRVFYDNLWDTISRGDVWSGVFINKRKDGRLIREEAVVSPVRDAEGELTNYVGVMRDVTREVELESQLLQSQKMEAIGQLAGGVAHDFNNILQSIMGCSEFLLMGLETEDENYELANEIHTGAERAAVLTRQLLAFSRRQVIEPRNIDPNDLVANLLKMLGRTLGEDIELNYRPTPDVGHIHADPGQVEQILMNLCVNARDAMPDGGQLIIETGLIEFDVEYCTTHSGAHPGEHVMIAVSDNGVGMDEATKERVFEPFFTTKESGTGTGLGLATVYGIVKQHSGSIYVYSEVGNGTTFKIYFPLVPADRIAEEEEEKREAPLGGMETILIAEDDEALRRLAKLILERAGYMVLVAEDGAEAVEIGKEHINNIDLALLDVVMPRLNGQQVAQALKEIRANLPIVFSSGYTESAVHKNYVLDEHIELIQKPYPPDVLLRRVREALDKSNSK